MVKKKSDEHSILVQFIDHKKNENLMNSWTNEIRKQEFVGGRKFQNKVADADAFTFAFLNIILFFFL